ncbi:MAG TPA: DUF5985 family protein [Candidatus Polarisedimenticolia bacterium]|nr:DUF5985 family protein [Candidatus Polarisedimenticolia bacterium]
MSSHFLWSAIVFGYLIVALFFLQFWKRSGDSFFLLFSLAFALMAIERLVLALVIGLTVDSFVYLIRLCAFLLIIVAIIRKNRG